ncbi:MAG: hypothetical protein R3302_08535, partial [Sulfurimonadaceae bacterium]|nr:hypothetical protein [Sulfurimonadaceae bacterium]
MKKFYIQWVSALALLLLFTGCTVKEYKTTEPKLITLKTKQLRFNDVGFIRKEGKSVQAELFSAGQAVERFEINRLVCVTKGCLTKSAFNADYLSAEYPDDLLQNVLLGRPIFGGAGLHKSDAGFEQHLKGSGFDIYYSVAPDSVYFKDRANGILIKIRDLPEP